VREHHLIRTPASYGTKAHETLLRKSMEYHWKRKGIKIMKMVIGPGDMTREKFESVITIIHFKKPRFIR
jgi:hypothetical protein